MAFITENPGTQETRRPFLWFLLVLAASVVLSVGGFFYGAYHDPNSDGGRGGALATAMAFASLFVRSSFSSNVRRTVAEIVPAFHSTIQELLKELGDEMPSAGSEPRNIQELRSQIEGITAQLTAKDREQFLQNLFVALASVIGTLSWGFGDIAAKDIKGWLS